MCSFDPAPFNLGIFQVAGRYEKFKYDWETGVHELLEDDNLCPHL